MENLGKFWKKGAILPTLNPLAPKPSGKNGRSRPRVRIPTIVNSPGCLPLVSSQEGKAKFHVVLLFPSSDVSSWIWFIDVHQLIIILFPRDSYCLLFCCCCCLFVFCFMSWEFGLSTISLEAPKIRPDRNGGCTPFASRVLPTVANSQGDYLSLSSFWIYSGSKSCEGSIFCTLFGDFSYIHGVVQYCQEYLLFAPDET